MKSFKEIYNHKRTVHYIPDKEGEYRYDTIAEKYVSIHDKNNNWLEDRKAYHHNDKPDTTIIGTALAFTSTLWEYLVCHSTLWAWFRGIVTDGYWLTFLSPFILVYWAFVSIFYIPIFLASSSLVVVSVYWTYLIELPASILNKEELPSYANISETPCPALFIVLNIFLVGIFIACR